MKNVCCILLLAVLGVGSLPLGAQDAPTRPLRQPLPSPQPSPTVRASPTATPTPASQQTTPTPQKTAPVTPESSPRESEDQAVAKKKITKTKLEASPATTPRKSAKKLKERPAPELSPKPAAETRSGPPESRRAVAAKLRLMEKEWEAGFTNSAVIDRLLADDFVGTSPAGDIVSKKSLTRDATNMSRSTSASSAHHLRVHFYGPNLAVIVGAAKQTEKDDAGQKAQHNYRFTDTWVERDGKWQCVASQATLLPRK